MGGKLRNFGTSLVVAASLALCAPALAAENDIRMPVDKSATPDPLGEMMKAKKAAPEKKAEDEKKAADERKGAAKRLEPDGVARGEARKPDEKRPEEKKQEEKKPEPNKSEPRKPEAKKPEPKKPELNKLEPNKSEPAKGEEKKAPQAKPEAAKAPAPKPATPKPVAPKPVAPKTEKKPAAAPAPGLADNATAPVAVKPTPAAKPAPGSDNATAPAPAPVPKPAPKPYVDPVAFVMPAAPAGGAPAHVELPGDKAGGLFLGDLSIEFQHTRIILRAATSQEVERVTHFYLKDLRRLALDLRGQWRRKGPAALRYDTGPVKHVVSGEHQDRLRLVVEFREGAVRPDLDPVVVREPGGGVTVTIPLAR